MEIIKKFLKSKQFRTACWHSVNGFVAMTIVYLSGESMAWTPLAIAALNMLTKFVNAKEKELL